MEEVRDFLQECRLGQRAAVLLPHLEQLGVGCLHDLLDVERENLEGAGEGSSALGPLVAASHAACMAIKKSLPSLA